MFFPFISMFWMKMKKKARNIFTFHGNSFFFSQNCINYPVSSVSWRINILSTKDHLYFRLEKRNICNFTKKVNILMIFCSFHCFHQTINKKHWILLQYTFFLKKKNKWHVFQRFRSINGILNKTPFYKYNICDLNYQFFNVYKGFTVCQIHIPLENKSMFLHPNVSFSVIFFEFLCFN